MPIYEYQCQACGHEEEFIQKISDAPFKKCPKCGKNKLQKQVSASAFHLKGAGWYVTDFRDKNKAKPGDDREASKPEKKEKAEKSEKPQKKEQSKDKSKKSPDKPKVSEK